MFYKQEKLENVLCSAGGNVTGLQLFAPREKLYLETGWKLLKSWGYTAKPTSICAYVRIYTGAVPKYLQDIVPKKCEKISTLIF